MCGFAGEIRFDGRAADVAAVVRMSELIAPRGPDAQGMFQQGSYAVAHRRLKIIDLSEHAQQPMIDGELGLTIVFNGCIYNYRELRGELEAKGYRFFSSGDTEVMLKAFHAWGDDCVQRLHGMFAFVVHERDSGRLTLARDRFGIKPLYICADRSRAALRIDAAGAARGGWHRYRDRPGGAASLHDLARRRAGAAHDPARRAQAAAGDHRA